MREVLKLALEALEEFGEHYDWCHQFPTYAFPENYPPCNCGYDKAIAAVKEALAQPEQEPVAHTLNCVCGAVWDIKADGSEEMVHTPNTTPPQRKPQKRPQNCGTGYCSCIECPYEQPAQEPVAWRWTESNGQHWFDWRTDWTHHDRAKAMGFAIEYAYTSPPASKRWMGLSTSDLDEIDAPIREKGHATIAEIYRAIEAKLREKNA